MVNLTHSPTDGEEQFPFDDFAIPREQLASSSTKMPQQPSSPPMSGSTLVDSPMASPRQTNYVLHSGRRGFFTTSSVQPESPARPKTSSPTATRRVSTATTCGSSLTRPATAGEQSKTFQDEIAEAVSGRATKKSSTFPKKGEVHAKVETKTAPKK
ncbi:hypothetical protein SCUCBS95973_004695 [Sporothrix curviconia]|uniref:Uncharacterized protein n=1 Tax=Sporothrix curviconia TaxID=1260050 RepID=A0ABP0BQN5_9PEZI